MRVHDVGASYLGLEKLIESVDFALNTGVYC